MSYDRVPDRHPVIEHAQAQMRAQVAKERRARRWQAFRLRAWWLYLGVISGAFSTLAVTGELRAL